MKKLLVLLLVLTYGEITLAQNKIVDGPGLTKQHIKDKIWLQATIMGLDPYLALSIAGVESGYRKYATGKAKEVGLFQLHPRFHKVYSYNSDDVIYSGLTYLTKLREKRKHIYSSLWFVSYNFGPYKKLKNPSKTPYAKKVTKLYGELVQHKRRTNIRNNIRISLFSLQALR